jgi:TfoX/Sxy family transcriptional regulator of competence genes
MAFDEGLAERIRKQLGKRKDRDLVEKKMFGGIAFLLNGNMCVGVHKQDLIVRLDPEDTDGALAEPHTRVFDLSGRPMKGWILVESGGLKDEKALGKWVRLSVDYALSLPKK